MIKPEERVIRTSMYSQLIRLPSLCAQSGPTLCDTVGYSLLSYSVHVVFQARILEWVAISFSRGSSQSRD